MNFFKFRLAAFLFPILILGCASTSDIDFSKADPVCAQQCTDTYSSCVSRFTMFPIMQQHQCTDAYKMCVQTCSVEGRPSAAASRQQQDELAQSCMNQLATDPRLDPIRSYLSLGSGKQPTIVQLSSAKRASSKEKNAILAWDEIVSDCYAKEQQIYSANGAPALYIENSRALDAKQKQLRADLWAGKISYGDYLKTSQKNRLESQAELSSRQDERSQREAQMRMQQNQTRAMQDQAAAQNRQAAAQTMMMINQATQQQVQQQQANQPRPLNAPGSPSNPIRTDCKRGMGGVECQTYSY